MANYKLNSKSDMRRFAKDLEKAIMKDIQSQKFDFTCPHCNHKIKVKTGKNKCQYCHNFINITWN